MSGGAAPSLRNVKGEFGMEKSAHAETWGDPIGERNQSAQPRGASPRADLGRLGMTAVGARIEIAGPIPDGTTHL
jgi:hypothetical protein